MTIYPAIDIKAGRCVRLTQGKADQETVYSLNPAEVAEQFKKEGSAWVHVVDLDGAFLGEPQNLETVKAISAVGLRVQLGGGLRTRAAVERALGFGVGRVVIGTRAAESAEFVSELVNAFGEKIAVGIDAKNGQVAVKGWVDTTDMGALELAKRMAGLGVRTIIYTDIGTDGMLTGPNLTAQAALAEAVAAEGAQVIASGGVSQLADVVALAGLAKAHANLHGVIIGKAIYEKRLTVAQALAAASA
jgi:phosphoribosylformimino-5-aminoimidazole carboxamide ribotide isomerase